MNGGRFLLVTWDGGGNVPVFVALGHRLARRGHRLRVLAPRSLEAEFSATGCDFSPLEECPEWTGPGGRYSNDQIVTLASLLSGEVVARAVARELEQTVPDVAVIDCMLFGAFAPAERSPARSVALFHMLYQPQSEGMWAAVWNGLLPVLNATRATFGAGPLESVTDTWIGADRVLVATPEGFDFARSRVDDRVRYVGPIFDEDPVEALPPSPYGDGSEPTVLVSFSTNYYDQDKPLQSVLDALAELPVRGLVTLGPAMGDSRLTVPPNVVAEVFIPHASVLGETDLVVTHAGHSTVMAALAAGVPLVCVPTGAEQPMQAERVEAIGAGRRVEPDASVAEFRAAIEDVLGSLAYRRAAQDMAAVIGNLGRGTRAVHELEGLLPGR
jgi:MGT family glycosyltransferase